MYCSCNVKQFCHREMYIDLVTIVLCHYIYWRYLWCVRRLCVVVFVGVLSGYTGAVRNVLR